MYQEVACATLSFCNAEGERLKTVRFARMPEAKKATLKSTVAAEVHAALAQRPTLTVVKVADGAPDNWTFLDTLAPEGHAVVDFFHAIHVTVLDVSGNQVRIGVTAPREVPVNREEVAARKKAEAASSG